MSLSVDKSKVLSNVRDVWEVCDSEGVDVTGCFEKVTEFRYLGIESQLSPYQGARSVQKRAIQGAKKYKGVCGRVARDGPDTVEVGMATWISIARTSFLFGTEFTPFTETVIQELDRIQAAMGKELLGLGRCAPNLSVEVMLGLRTVREVIYTSALKFFVRLKTQPEGRWSRDALLAHLVQGWKSPYIDWIPKIKTEINMSTSPVSGKHVNIVVDSYFHSLLNDKVTSLDLPALMTVDRRRMAEHVDETEESQVSHGIVRSGAK